MSVVPISGHIVNMKTTDPLHYNGNGSAGNRDKGIGSSFSDMLGNAIGKINDLEVDSNRLTEKMIYQPEKVDIHTVMIAQQKAEIALSFTKTVRDEALKAYREITNLR